MESTAPLHTLSSGAKLRLISSNELIRIPVWKGNRVIDMEHVENIRRAVQGNVQQLDFGYRIVIYKTVDAAGRPTQESALVDGQHRARVVREFYENTLCEPPFQVVVLEKEVESELEVISYFNALNNAKPIQYKDVNMVINLYIEALERVFNGTKRGAPVLIRPKATCRPYLSVEKIREGLAAVGPRLRTTRPEVASFAAAVKEWNEKRAAVAEIDALGCTNSKQIEYIKKAAAAKFMLAVDSTLPWIAELI